MRVTLIAPPWYPVPPQAYGGIELVVALLAREMERRGHQVTVAASGGSHPAGSLRSPLPEPPDPSLLGNSWYEAFHALRAYDEIMNADIVHDHSSVIGAAIASRGRSVPPVVHTLHGPWTDETRMFYPLVDERLHLVAISEAQRASNGDVHYAGTVYNGIDTDVYRMDSGKRDDYLVYIGRADNGKNPDGAIRVARASGRPLKLVAKCAEPPEREYWETEVEPLLGSDVEVLEDVDQDAKVALLRQAHAMVFPIQWPEPFGLVMVEAMACGTPVIAGRRGAASELIDHGCTGFLCDSEDDMARALDLVDELDRAACHEWVSKNFSAQSMAQGYEQLFERML